MVGRPKVKRNRVADEALKRKGEWGSSRKRIIMTCSKCAYENHNAKECYKSNSVRLCSKKRKDLDNTPTLTSSEDETRELGQS